MFEWEVCIFYPVPFAQSGAVRAFTRLGTVLANIQRSFEFTKGRQWVADDECDAIDWI